MHLKRLGLYGLKKGGLSGVRSSLGECHRCELAQTRRNIVFGNGNPRARVVLVGEAPGAEEDRTGIAFVGAAGKLLTRMLAAIGLDRDDVYICNVLKCRPPNNRDPLPEEVAVCSPFLKAQLETIHPDLVLTLGAYAARTLLGREGALSRLRGRRLQYSGMKLIATYHPSYLLRNPGAKAEAWKDLKLVAGELDRRKMT
ncbi:MAG: uracil-DNA glycosylase [Deltaproteobacteria bacterium]|nr:uracil-DNA glycosylase [Deltaproteobacteria bacterium]